MCKRKIADTKIAQTKTKPLKKLEFKLAKSVEIASLSPPLKVEEESYMLSATKLEVNSSVFGETERNIKLTNYTPGD